MKKKIVFLLTLAMTMAVPLSAYAIGDEEAEKIYNDINETNDGNNGFTVEFEDGKAVDGTNSGPVYIPTDENGDFITYEETDPDTGEVTTEVITSETDPDDLPADIDPEIIKPKVFRLHGSAEDGSLELTEESPALKIDPPSDQKGLLKSYAVIMVDYDAPDRPVHWLATGIEPARADGEVVETIIPPDAASGEDFTQGVRFTVPEEGRYRVIIYALSIDDPFADQIDGFTQEEFESAIEGHVIAQSRLIGKY